MNLVILMGRLTRDPEIRYGSGANGTQIAHYRLAVDRRFKRDGQPEADFFDCVAFGRQAEFAEKYLHQGTKMVVQGRLQNDNYQDREGRMVYRTQIIIDNQEFAESKSQGRQNAAAYQAPAESSQPPYSAPASAAPAYSAPAAPAYSAPARPAAPADDDEFMNIPSGIEEELPFE